MVIFHTYSSLKTVVPQVQHSSQTQFPPRDCTPEGRELYYFPLHLAKHFPVLWTTSILYLQQSCLDWNKGISYWAITFTGLCSKMYNGRGEVGWGGHMPACYQTAESNEEPVCSHTQSKIHKLPYITSPPPKEHQPIHLTFISQCQGWHSRCLYDLMFLLAFVSSSSHALY